MFLKYFKTCVVVVVVAVVVNDDVVVNAGTLCYHMLTLLLLFLSRC